MIRLDGDIDVTISDIVDSESLRDAIVNVTQPAELPRPALLSARTDAYIMHIFHHCPVVDRSELLGARPSILVQHALYIVGNLLRRDSTGPEKSREIYQKLKLLLSINYEQDCVQILKCLCLMSCWAIKPSSPVSLDGPRKWTGLAIQLVIQMGLHRESTYARRTSAGCLRRIFWQLYVCYFPPHIET